MTNNEITPKVSIIIPVWNPGPGIRRCVESLRGQTLEDIEMIFVDDCGTDNAMDVVHAAAKEDPRIRIIENPENLGPGISRNKGIKEARGEYLSFVDADDYVNTVFLERLYIKAVADKLDIVKGKYVYEKEDGTAVQKRYKLNDEILIGKASNQPLFYLFQYEFQSGLYHSKLFANPDVRFGLTSIAEDTTFLLKVCHIAESFGIEEHAEYHYLRRKSSASNVITKVSLDERAIALNDKIIYLNNHILQNPYMDLSFSMFLKGYLSLQRHVSRMPGMEEAAAQFLVDLRSVAINYLSINTIKGNDCTVCALVDYGQNLAEIPYCSPWSVSQPEDYADVVVRRVNFLQSHTEYYKEFPALIYRAKGFAKQMKSDGISKEEIEAYEKQIRALWWKPIIMWMWLKNSIRADRLKRVPAKLKKCFDGRAIRFMF